MQNAVLPARGYGPTAQAFRQPMLVRGQPGALSALRPVLARPLPVQYFSQPKSGPFANFPRPKQSIGVPSSDYEEEFPEEELLDGEPVFDDFELNDGQLSGLDLLGFEGEDSTGENLGDELPTSSGQSAQGGAFPVNNSAAKIARKVTVKRRIVKKILPTTSDSLGKKKDSLTSESQANVADDFTSSSTTETSTKTEISSLKQASEEIEHVARLPDELKKLNQLSNGTSGSGDTPSDNNSNTKL